MWSRLNEANYEFECKTFLKSVKVTQVTFLGKKVLLSVSSIISSSVCFELLSVQR